MQQSEELEQQLFDLKDHIYDLNEELSMRIRSDVISIFFFIELHCKIAYQENDIHWNNVFFSLNSCYKESQLQVKALQRTMKGKYLYKKKTVYNIYM